MTNLALHTDAIVCLIQRLGARYEECFHRKSTHLISRDLNGQKCAKAVEWHIPIVTAEWLYACARDGTTVSPEAHQLHASAPTVAATTSPKRASPLRRPVMQMVKWIRKDSQENPPKEPSSSKSRRSRKHNTPKAPLKWLMGGTQRDLFANTSAESLPQQATSSTNGQPPESIEQTTEAAGTAAAAMPANAPEPTQSAALADGVACDAAAAATADRAVTATTDSQVNPDRADAGHDGDGAVMRDLVKRLITAISEPPVQPYIPRMNLRARKAKRTTNDGGEAGEVASGTAADVQPEPHGSGSVGGLLGGGTATKRLHAASTVDPQASQVDVTYDDPARKIRQRIMTSMLHGDAQGDAGNTSEALPQGVSQGASRAPAQRNSHRFLLSSLEPEQRQRLAAIIVQLGGLLLESSSYDPSCTHVVVGMPTRTEKYLAACAAGKWLVWPSYLDASARAGRFVDEAEHECVRVRMRFRHAMVVPAR